MDGEEGKAGRVWKGKRERMADMDGKEGRDGRVWTGKRGEWQSLRKE